QGDKGDQGDQGAQGDKGDQGDQGAQGDKGDQGAQGAQGDKGDQGDQGAQGDKGDKGDQGDKGDKGDRGDQGSQGNQGAPGMSSLIEMSNEPAGANCPGAGGKRIVVGIDTNGNGSLSDEVNVHVGFVCSPSRARVVFSSSATYNGNLGGLAGADAKCQALADVVPALAGKTFKAWISDNTASPSSRFSRDGYFVRPDHTTFIAYSWSGLTSGSILNALSVDETGTAVSLTGSWTGTSTDGTRSLTNCSQWSSSASGQQGTEGRVSLTTASWSAAGTVACNNTRRLFCFEQ
ncbi:MAG: DUF1554 domain-containing protein, partial [Labilithrix sp.]|nr:DUF1554 domain-containing protein [Labilithrix sp.]